MRNVGEIDIIKISKVFGYLFVMAFLMFAGAIIKDIAVIGIISVFFFYVLTRRMYKAIELCFIWFFIYYFFVGQGYMTFSILEKYVAKPTFLFFLIFLFILNRLPVRLFKPAYFLYGLFFLILAFLGTVIQGQSPFVLITWSSFFFVFFILQGKGFTKNQYINLLNLFVAVAVLQTVVSLLQVAHIIPPPSKMMDDGSGGQFKWVPGLDDVASGTFGPGAGHLTSWYAALISLLMLLIWSITKKRVYIMLFIITFLQFATIDSKTILAVAALMIVYTFIYIARKRKFFEMDIARYIYILILAGVGAYGFYMAWDAYYQHYSAENHTKQRSNVSAVMDNMVKKTNTAVWENLDDWGKIRGYQYIYTDFKKIGFSKLVWGYGLNGYTYNGKMAYIESLDTPAMKLNNFTRSRSGLINVFAQTGLIGFILYGFSFVYWKSYNQLPLSSPLNVVAMSLLNIFFIFSVLVAFLYAITANSIPLIVYGAIISILISLAKKIRPMEVNSSTKVV